MTTGISNMTGLPSIENFKLTPRTLLYLEASSSLAKWRGLTSHGLPRKTERPC